MKLETYLSQTRISQAVFAEKIGTTQASVARYAAGKRIPRPDVMARIQDATDGQVTPSDFYSSWTEDAA